MKRRTKRKISGLLWPVVLFGILCVTLWLTEIRKEENREVSGMLEVYFPDVGQGDAAVILCGEHAMMIDGGGPEASSYIYTFLKENEITHLEYMIATHPHADHVGGLSGALHAVHADTIYCNTDAYASSAFEAFARTVEESGNVIMIPQEGTTFSLGEAQVNILACNRLSGENENDRCIIVRIDFGGNRFLFMADGEKELEEALLYEDIRADVLKVGHHGSGTSTTEAFLSEVDPVIAVIGVGEDNEYGHPHASVLNRLDRYGITIYRTDVQGMIHCTGDGNTVGCDVEKHADGDVLTPGVPH